MSRSNMKTLLLAGCAACLAGILCQPAAGKKAKPPATTRPTTRPAKVNITVGKDTTYITGPLNADGTVNYVAHLNATYGKGVTPKNNAMVLLVRAIGPEPWQHKTQAKALKMIGIAMPPPKGDYFVTMDQYAESLPENVPPVMTPAQKKAAKRRKELARKMTAGELSEAELAELMALPSPPRGITDKAEEQKASAMERPWSSKKFPIVAGWLKANAKPLALMVAASKRPRLYLPMVSRSDPPSVVDTPSKPLSELLGAAKALSARAMWRLESGDRAGAWADIMALRRLGRLFASGPTLIDQLVGLTVDALGCECSLVYITHRKLPPERLRACLADMRAMRPLPNVNDAIANERFMVLDVVMLLARGQGITGLMGNGNGIGQVLAKAITKRLFDWDEMLRTFNHWHDRLGKALGEKNFRKRRELCEKLDGDFQKLAAKTRSQSSGLGLAKLIAKAAVGLNSESLTKRTTELLVAMLMPSLGRLVDMYDTTVTRGQLVHVASALAFHEAQRGMFPKALADLAPKYLKAVPTDRFSGKPLVYKRQGKGCIVYSLGENLKDDGGINFDRDEDAEGEEDDLVVRFKR